MRAVKATLPGIVGLKSDSGSSQSSNETSSHLRLYPAGAPAAAQGSIGPGHVTITCILSAFASGRSCRNWSSLSRAQDCPELRLHPRYTLLLAVFYLSPASIVTDRIGKSVFSDLFLFGELCWRIPEELRRSNLLYSAKLYLIYRIYVKSTTRLAVSKLKAKGRHLPNIGNQHSAPAN